MANLMIDESGSGYTPGSLLKPFYKNLNQGVARTAFGQQFGANEEIPGAPSGFDKIKNKFSDLLSSGNRDEALKIASNAVAGMAGSSAVQSVEKFFSNMLEQHDLFQKANEQDNQNYPERARGIGYGEPPLPGPVPPPPNMDTSNSEAIKSFGNADDYMNKSPNLNRRIK
jgi:hypothetical protein